MGWINRLAVELGDEYMRDSADDVLGSAFEQIGEVDFNGPFAQADGCVQTGESAKTYIEERDRRARA